MTRNIKINREKIEIGEKILVVDGVIVLGKKPGWLDKILGEKDIRRKIINGEIVDSKSMEYQQKCEATYNDLRTIVQQNLVSPSFFS